MRRAAILSIALCLAGCSSAPRHYAQSCAAPLAHWLTPAQDDGEPAGQELVELKKDGALHWNRKPVTADALERYLRMAGDLPFPTRITLRIDPAADCTAVQALRTRMDATPICSKQKMCSER